MFDDDLALEVSRLGDKVDTVIRFLHEQIHLQRQALLEPGHVLRFLAENGEEIAMSLPMAQSDLIQRSILRSHVFFENDMLSAVRRKGIVTSQSVVCDVGANIGNHTVHFCRVMGAAKVLSFEPQHAIHSTLMTNIRLNELKGRVSAFNCLVGSGVGAGRIASFDFRNTGSASFERTETGEFPMVSLDDVVEAEDVGRLDLIKIDVEGMQDEVIKGAKHLIETRRPALWVEILQKDRNSSEAFSFLSRLGYKAERLGVANWLFRH